MRPFDLRTSTGAEVLNCRWMHSSCVAGLHWMAKKLGFQNFNHLTVSVSTDNFGLTHSHLVLFQKVWTSFLELRKKRMCIPWPYPLSSFEVIHFSFPKQAPEIKSTIFAPILVSSFSNPCLLRSSAFLKVCNRTSAFAGGCWSLNFRSDCKQSVHVKDPFSLVPTM